MYPDRVSKPFSTHVFPKAILRYFPEIRSSVMVSTSSASNSFPWLPRIVALADLRTTLHHPIACFIAAFILANRSAKPSAVSGGLFLGIISYNTRSIWGGLLVHLGIAWSMELGGWFWLLDKKK